MTAGLPRALLAALAGAGALTAACRRPPGPAHASRGDREVAVAAGGTVAGTGAGRAEVRALRTTLTRHGDSLRAVVTWKGAASGVVLRLATTGDGTREVRPAGDASATTSLPVPRPGATAQGTACLVRIASTDTLACTPWQFVRPSAAAAGRGIAIVVRPDGIQVDPDVDGRCAAWRAAHPDAPAWLAVNEAAVPACTGPNGRPTIAQFCAFALLPDGRKAKTAGSSNNPYCEEEFEHWLAERAS